MKEEKCCGRTQGRGIKEEESGRRCQERGILEEETGRGHVVGDFREKSCPGATSEASAGAVMEEE